MQIRIYIRSYKSSIRAKPTEGYNLARASHAYIRVSVQWDVNDTALQRVDQRASFWGAETRLTSSLQFRGFY